MAALVLAILVIPSLPPLALGGSQWQRAGTGFDTSGVTKSNIAIGADGITLAYNTTPLNDWINVSQLSGPKARYGHAMAMDTDTGQIVLFGGVSDGQPALNDTWVFNITTLSWTEVTPLDSPPVRWGHGLVYDPDDKVFIMFGGKDYGGCLMDIWQYNITTNLWTQRAGNGYMGPRANFAMAYDSVKHLVVLVGGWKDSPATYYNDTAVYDYGHDQWTQKTSLPADAREDPGMAYDRDSVGMLFYGGTVGSLYYGDTWFYNTTTDHWSRWDVGGSSIPAMFGVSMAYDSSGKKMALFGGYQTNSPSSQNKLWYYNRSTDQWSLAAAAHKPGPREDIDMVYDESTDELVVFGGIDEYVHQFKDTWVYDLKEYLPSGSYISEPLDMQGNASFGKILMDAKFPAGTEGGVRIRTGATSGEMLGRNFTGPGGAVNNYYISNDDIDASHDGARWLQYKVILRTNAASVTPTVTSVDIRYNLIQDLTIGTPAGGESWTGPNNITWDATDYDNDILSYDVQLIQNGSVNKTLASNLAKMYYMWDTNSTANGTYQIRVIAKDDNVSIPVIVNRTSASFTIHHPVPDSPPTVMLLLPTNGATLLVNQTRLNWSGHDNDGDALTYYVFLDDKNGSTLVSTTLGTDYLAKNLKDNTTYYWTVKAFDGKVNGSAAPVWGFWVRINGPPKFLSTPITTAFVNVTYTYDVNASDPDTFDQLTYSLPVGPAGMTIDKNSGLVQWTPNATKLGSTNPVKVNVTDGNYNVSQDFILNVKKPPVKVNSPPNITSMAPTNALVGYRYTYKVIARDDDIGDSLNYSLLVKPTGMTIGLKTGLVEWTPAYDQLGPNPVKLHVDDGKAGVNQTFTVTVAASISNHPPRITNQAVNAKVTVGKNFTYNVQATDDDSGDQITYSLTSAPTGMTISGTGLISWTPAKGDVGAHTVTINITDGKGGFDQQTFTLTVVKKPSTQLLFSNPLFLVLILLVIIIVVAAIGFTVWSRRRKAEAKASEITIDDIFLIYRDGRLISHHTRKLKPDIDDQVLTGMFTAVTDFIKESLGGEETKAVNEIAYGDNKILLEHGKYIYIAAVVTGENVKEMHGKMRTAVQNIEVEYATVLKGWEGDAKALAGAKKWVQTLIPVK